MASAQLTEEQLQQSAVLSEEDADHENTTYAPAQGSRSPNDISWMTSSRSDALFHMAGDDRAMRRAMTGQEGIEMGDGMDGLSELSDQGLLDQGTGHTLEDDVDVQMGQNNREVAFESRSRSSSSLEQLDEDEDDVEGVGAVKIRPGDTDDDGDDLDSDHSDSQSDFDNESDGAAAWDNVAEGDDNDEGSEDGESNPCTFCKQDEEHDPAHQSCAREAGALTNTTLSYRNYWRLVLCRYLLDHLSEDLVGCTGLSIRQISDDTGLTPDDVISALEGLRCLVRDPLTELYAFRVDLAYCAEYVLKWERKDYVTLNPDALTWTPYVMGRGNATNFELGPAISAIAPREEEDTQRTTVEPLPVSLRCEGVSNSRSLTDLAVGSGVAEDGPALTEENRADGDGVGARVQPVPEELADILDQEHSCGDDMQKALHQNEELDEGEETDEVGEDATSQTSEEHLVPSHLIAVDWTMLYRDLPPSRFEVFPPPWGRRADRSRNLGSRPALARSASTGSRPRRTGIDGSARRQAASRPKSSSSSRRKSGGTGRGPGRWPKGTKKSDYGNADSGPGLPPAWIKERARLAAGAAVAVTDGEVDGVTLDNRETIDVARFQLGEAGSTTTAMSRDGSSVESVHNEVEV
ncbi:Histone acetyltransferase mst2 [Colletotrichum trifolii]|uniref:Histone acetyltransferase n=1 Tax=Colletotrichum trifolii TaxID=5466 RepID=A0A4R8QCI3_COLTR|nr:Histone acetyltransferase mst2 [Colletotrichum trifolii]